MLCSPEITYRWATNPGAYEVVRQGDQQQRSGHDGHATSQCTAHHDLPLDSPCNPGNRETSDL